MNIAARGGAALSVIAALFLTGCSAQPAPAPTVTVTVTAPAEAASPTPSPASPAAASALALGETKKLSGATVTAHAFRADSTPAPAPQPQTEGDRWASLEVELCNTGSQQFTVSGGPWSLVAADNRTFTESSTGYDQFPQPRFAFGDQLVLPGECRRGWVTFVVNGDATITTVRYSNSQGETAKWSVS